ncbi:hypothetical protein BC936DRAFT_148603, partial [Jimgerdemannia flammicorona]
GTWHDGDQSIYWRWIRLIGDGWERLWPECGEEVVLAKGLTWGDRIEKIKTSEGYSEAFRIVIRTKQDETTEGQTGEGPDVDAVPPELQPLHIRLQQSLDASLNAQRQQVESRVQQFRQQQLALLELTQQKAREDKDHLWRRIKSVAATVSPTPQPKTLTPPSRRSSRANEPDTPDSTIISATPHHHVHFEDTSADGTTSLHVHLRSPPPKSSVLSSPAPAIQANSDMTTKSVPKTPTGILTGSHTAAKISRTSSSSSFASVSTGSPPNVRAKPIAGVSSSSVHTTPTYIPFSASFGRPGLMSAGRRPNLVMDEAEIVASFRDQEPWGPVAEKVGRKEEEDEKDRMERKRHGKGKGKERVTDEADEWVEDDGQYREKDDDQMFELDEDVEEEFEEVEEEEEEEEGTEAEAELEQITAESTAAGVEGKFNEEKGIETKARDRERGVKVAKANGRLNGIMEVVEDGGKERRRVVKKKAVRKYVPDIEDSEFLEEEEDGSVPMSLPAGAHPTNIATTATTSASLNFATSLPIAIVRHQVQHPTASTTTTNGMAISAATTALSSTFGRHGASVVQPSVMASAMVQDGLRYDLDDDDEPGPMVPPHVLVARTYTDETEKMFGAVPRSGKWGMSGI